MGEGLDQGTLDADEQALVDRVEERRDDLVALACELIGYDTTSRSENDEPAREEAALQQALADRLAAAGAEIDLWEPAPEDAADHPLSIEGIGFEGRPQLAATLRGSGGGRSLLLNGHIDVVPAAPRGGLGPRPVRPAGRRRRDRRPRRVRHEGRDRGDGRLPPRCWPSAAAWPAT